MYWDLPRNISYPAESYKYISTKWNDDYTWNILSYRVYGNASYFWLLMMVNEIVDPYGIENGDTIKVLLPKYLNEVKTK